MGDDLGLRTSPVDGQRIKLALAALAREEGVAETDLKPGWSLNSSSSMLISVATAPGRSFVIKLSKELINYSDTLFCPTWRSWNEFVWMHTAAIDGDPNTLRPLRASALDGYLILPELPRDRFRDLRSRVIDGAADPGVVLDIFLSYMEVRERLAEGWAERMPFRSPEVIFLKFRIVPHFFALMGQYPNSGIAEATGKVIRYMVEERRTVIHGDFSPKNVMVGEGEHFLIDAEAAGVGNGDFDPLFFLSQLLIESNGFADRRPWNEVAQDALGLAFPGQALTGERARIGSSMLATMMLARLEGMARPKEYDRLRISPAFVDCVRRNLVSPADLPDFLREIGGL